MILFFDPNNTAPIKDYKTMVETELISEKRKQTYCALHYYTIFDGI